MGEQVARVSQVGAERSQFRDLVTDFMLSSATRYDIRCER